MFTLAALCILLIFSVCYFALALNPIESVLWLMLTFAVLAILVFFIHLEFLAATLIVLYVSAVIVLFIYIILMMPKGIFSLKVHPFFVFAFFVFAFFAITGLAHNFLYIPKYSDFLFKSFFVENNILFLSDFLLNHSQLLGVFLFSAGALFFVAITVVFFVTLIGIMFLAK